MASFTILQGFVPTGTTFGAATSTPSTSSRRWPWPSIFDYFQVLHIVDKDQAAAPITQPQRDRSPFKFVEWVQGQYLRFEKHPNYWLSGQAVPGLGAGQRRADIQAMTAELEAGASDLIILPSWIDFQRLKSDPKYQAIVTPMPGYFYMFQPNVTFKPLDDKRVRQALNYAIDRKRIVESVILATQETMATPWRPNSPRRLPSSRTLTPSTWTRRSRCSTQAGISRWTFDMVIPTGVTEYATMTQIYQNDLQKIGITLDDQAAGRRAAARADAKPDLKRHVRFQRHLGSHGAVSFFTSSSIAGVKTQQRGYYNDRYTQLVDTIASEPDAAKRKALYPALNDFLLDESFYMAITGNPGKVLATARLKGMTYRPERPVHGDGGVAGLMADAPRLTAEDRFEILELIHRYMFILDAGDNITTTATGMPTCTRRMAPLAADRRGEALAAAAGRQPTVGTTRPHARCAEPDPHERRRDHRAHRRGRKGHLVPVDDRRSRQPDLLGWLVRGRVRQDAQGWRFKSRVHVAGTRAGIPANAAESDAHGSSRPSMR